MTIDQICTEHIEQEGTAAIVTEFLRTTTAENMKQIEKKTNESADVSCLLRCKEKCVCDTL